MVREDGFTLLEMLIVIFLWSVLILFVIPIDMNIIDKKQEEAFLETFAFDVLYAQSISTTTKDYVRINLQKDSYRIRIGNLNNKMIERKLPKGWSIDFRTMSIISFDNNGRMKTPGNILIHTKNTTYKVVFPFGKGRFYTVEQ